MATKYLYACALHDFSGFHTNAPTNSSTLQNQRRAVYYTLYIGRSKNFEPPRTSNNLVPIRGRVSQGSTLRLIDSHGSPSYAQSNYFTQVEPTSSPVTEGPKKKPTNTEVWRVRQLINKMFSKKPALHPAALRLSKLVKMLCCFFIKSAQYC